MTILLFLVLFLLVVSPLMVTTYMYLQIADADNFQSLNTSNGMSRSTMHISSAIGSSQHTIIKNENPFPTSPVSLSSPDSKPLLRIPITHTTQGSPKSCDASIGVSCFQQGLTSGLSNGEGNAQIGRQYNDSCLGGSTNLDGPGIFTNQTADDFCKGFHEGYVTGYYNLTLENPHP